jgi:prevent-host-death family protein
LEETVEQYNIQEAKTRLATLVAKASAGEYSVIAKAGRPMAVLGPYQKSKHYFSKVGFMPEIRLPDDYDEMGDEEILALFGSDPR